MIGMSVFGYSSKLLLYLLFNKDLQTSVFQRTIEVPNTCYQIRGQELLTFSFQILWHTIVPLCDGTGDTGQGITIAAQGNGGADDIFKTISRKESGDSFRYGFLAGFHMVVGGANFITGTAQIIAKLLLDIGLDLCLAAAGAG